jgi:hypothetical protein
MKLKDSDIRLERDARYVTAAAKLTELKSELNTLEQQRIGQQSHLADVKDDGQQSALDMAAKALLSEDITIESPTQVKDVIRKSIEDLDHRIAVLRRACELQKSTVGALTAEIGKQISLELKPAHAENVRKVIAALLVLDEAIGAESDLRDTCNERGIPISAHIRAMPVHSIGRLKDENSRLSAYIREAVEFGMIDAADVPAIVRDRLPPPPKPAAKPAGRSKAQAEGWLAA